MGEGRSLEGAALAVWGRRRSGPGEKRPWRVKTMARKSRRLACLKKGWPEIKECGCAGSIRPNCAVRSRRLDCRFDFSADLSICFVHQRGVVQSSDRSAASASLPRNVDVAAQQHVAQLVVLLTRLIYLQCRLLTRVVIVKRNADTDIDHCYDSNDQECPLFASRESRRHRSLYHRYCGFH